MKKLLFFASLLALAAPAFAQRLRAFPTAEGFGAYTSGGRGGRVVYVTHVEDVLDKTHKTYFGSLRAALNADGNDPITVVFKCGGVIELKDIINTSRSNITIAGQTALGKGICVGKYGVKLVGSNIIVRHVRFRTGIDNNMAALELTNGKNYIVDHCAFSWSKEENSNITNVDSVSVQWCINSESLCWAGHAKGERAYAAQWGGQRASYHHNLLAHHNSRMPRQNGNTAQDYQLTWDYRNNVHYNWGSEGAFYGGGVEQSGGYSHSNLVGNYFIPSTASPSDTNKHYFCAPSLGRNNESFTYGLWWLAGNVMENNKTGGVNYKKTNNNLTQGLRGANHFYATSEFAIPEPFRVSTTTAAQAYTDVIAQVGAFPKKRCYVDSCIIADVTLRTTKRGRSATSGENTAGIIDDPFDPRGLAYKPRGAPSTWGFKNLYPTIDSSKAGYAQRDTDRDGMPDWWESANGLDLYNPADRNNLHASGYTMLEVYLNALLDLELPTSVAKNKAMPYLRVYPNPVVNELNIETLLPTKTVEIYNLQGAKVATFAAHEQQTFGISLLTRGNYFVKVIFANGKIATAQVIKN